jgi:glutamine---fructose-6-phosphate transaminase (isomerizing)
MKSLMRMEALEAPEAVQRFLEVNAAGLKEVSRAFTARPPLMAITSARGSSDHAAAYFKYLLEINCGIPCSSIGASVVTLYGAHLKLEGGIAVTFSQSGRSPDILMLQAAARDAGAYTIAVLNDTASPAASGADTVLALSAGVEKSVAATKSFIVSLVAAAAVVAALSCDEELMKAIARLPDDLHRASQLQWHGFAECFAETGSMYVLGRGPSYPIACEAALKLKETSALHAEAFSFAEVMHGPLELLQNGFRVLAFVPEDETQASNVEALARIEATGALVKRVGTGPGNWPVQPVGHSLLTPISIIQSAYLAMESLAVARGRDPDKPRNLNKVTETV